jgi:RimJ/RimL family protein N-acetyltransferase
LSPVDESYVPVITRWINDPEITVHLLIHEPKTKQAEAQYIASLATSKGSDCVLVILVDGKPIGMMGLHGIDYRNGTATTGALIGEKAYQGKGYGVEAKMLLLEYAFNTLNLRKVCSNVHEFNKYSVKYSKKCGYRIEGRRKDQHYSQGRYWDQIQMAVFREDFIPLWKKFAKKHKGKILTQSFKKKKK